MIEAQTSTHTPEAKRRIRGIANEAVRLGELVRQPCETCGAEKTEAHHDDYSKPLDVRWLCKPCHAVIHRNTHCKRGHTLAGDNLFITGAKRLCRQCYRVRDRLAKQRKRSLTGSRT